jgi:phosphoenolpyruvate phosphomutase
MNEQFPTFREPYGGHLADSRRLSDHRAAFRSLIRGSKQVLIMEAHDAISARIAARAGFQALWASGLTMSSVAGYRDCSEMSWTDLVNRVAIVIEASNRPVLVDADNGFGNFNNFRIIVQRLSGLGAAGVVVEDKLFPKLNSLVDGPQDLEAIGSFCGKIKAGLDARLDPEFQIIARVEALISGHGVDEALDRAHAYCEAGADGVFLQSRQPTANEVFAFARRWNRAAPLLLAPTTFSATMPSEYAAHGIGAIICANHSLRSAMRAMQNVCARILATGGIHALGDDVVPIAELFDLMDYQELARAQKIYE